LGNRSNAHDKDVLLASITKLAFIDIFVARMLLLATLMSEVTVTREAKAHDYSIRDTRRE